MEKCFSLTEINEIAKEIINKANSRVLLFYGEMGSGKTTLISHLVQELGNFQDVSSPTFSIVNEYSTENGLVYHFDFYRIKDELEALDIGFEDYINSGHWCLIEWPEKIANLLPSNVNKIYLESIKNKRKIKFNINQ